MDPCLPMPHPRPPQITPSEITPRAEWESRRAFLRGVAAAGVGALLGVGGRLSVAGVKGSGRLRPITGVQSTDHGAGLVPTDYADFTTYNNFVELGVGKEGPARKLGHLLRTRPWTVRVEGECEAPGAIGIDDVLPQFPQEERIYRLRCVEAWAAVVPWVGVRWAPCWPFQAHLQGEVRRDRVDLRSDRLPGQRRPSCCVALYRGPADRRGDAPADAARDGVLRRGAARGRTAHRCGSSCPGSTASRAPSRSCASDSSSRCPRRPVECAAARRIRFLRERQPEGRPPSLEPGTRAADSAKACSPAASQP